jgi:hypothetical protein
MAVLAAGCGKVDPNITASEELPAIQLDSNTFAKKSFVNFSPNLTGTISKFSDFLEFSADSGRTWIRMTNAQVTAFAITSCEKLVCPFSATVSDVANLWSEVGALSANSSAVIKIRGNGKFGATAPASLNFQRLSGQYTVVAKFGLTQKSATLASLTPSGYKVEGVRLQARAPLPVAGSQVFRGFFR